MDWTQLISVVSELVKDEGIREQIYKRLLEASDYTERENIEEECLGYDDAFDNVWEEYFSSDEDDEDFEEDEDYDDESKDGFEYGDE
jgi:hypothetical protein